MILEIFENLRSRGDTRSMAAFSRDYVGRDRRYTASVRAGAFSPSIDALMRLYAGLRDKGHADLADRVMQHVLSKESACDHMDNQNCSNVSP